MVLPLSSLPSPARGLSYGCADSSPLTGRMPCLLTPRLGVQMCGRRGGSGSSLHLEARVLHMKVVVVMGGYVVVVKLSSELSGSVMVSPLLGSG